MRLSIDLPLNSIVAELIDNTIVHLKDSTNIHFKRSSTSLKELVRSFLAPQTQAFLLRHCFSLKPRGSATQWILESIHLGNDRIKCLQIDQPHLKQYICDSSSEEPVFCILIDAPSYFSAVQPKHLCFRRSFFRIVESFSCRSKTFKTIIVNPLPYLSLKPNTQHNGHRTTTSKWLDGHLHDAQSDFNNTAQAGHARKSSVGANRHLLKI